MTNNIIVLNTCDAYEDVWELFFCAFNEYWPECQYEIVLNTESIQKPLLYARARIHNFSSPTGRDMWGLRLKETLRACKSTYVTMLYDDFVLDGPVDKVKIATCLRYLNDNPDIAVFYLTNNSANENIDDNRFENFELIPPRGEYKLNSAPAVWRREKLMQFVDDSDNPWAWEFFGSYRTYDRPELYYCVKKNQENIYPYNYAMGGAIYRGKWVGKIVIPLIKKYGIQLNTTTRGFADNLQSINTRSLLWKINFLLLGFKMIGFGAFLPIYRVIRKKLKV